MELGNSLALSASASACTLRVESVWLGVFSSRMDTECKIQMLALPFLRRNCSENRVLSESKSSPRVFYLDFFPRRLEKGLRLQCPVSGLLQKE